MIYGNEYIFSIQQQDAFGDSWNFWDIIDLWYNTVIALYKALYNGDINSNELTPKYE